MQDAKSSPPKKKKKSQRSIARFRQPPVFRVPPGVCSRQERETEAPQAGEHLTAAHAEPPALPAPASHRLSLLGTRLSIELQAVPDHTAPIVLEADPPFALRDKALGHHVTHDPTADAFASCIDGRVFEPPRPVACPVVRCLRWGWVCSRLGRQRVARPGSEITGIVRVHGSLRLV